MFPVTSFLDSLFLTKVGVFFQPAAEIAARHKVQNSENRSMSRDNQTTIDEQGSSAVSFTFTSSNCQAELSTEQTSYVLTTTSTNTQNTNNSKEKSLNVSRARNPKDKKIESPKNKKTKVATELKGTIAAPDSPRR